MLRRCIKIAIVFAIVISARSVLADHYHVPTESMEPTVNVGDRIFVDKSAYGLRLPLTNVYVVSFDGPSVGDVVVLESPEDGETLLKRVVAVPGDRVEVRAGRLMLNGERARIRVGDDGRLLESLGGAPHPIRLSGAGGPDLAARTIPADHYLVMGDNRGLSHDGRSFGWVHRASIHGQAIAVFHAADEGFTWRGL